MPAAPDLRLLAERMTVELGLHFPPDRLEHLREGFARAARDFGMSDAECAGWLLATPWSETQMRKLASHLTIGETYFFRDTPLMNVVAGRILPELVRHKRAQGLRELRMWSAGCCTGEEAYSLSMLLEDVLPDLAEWSATVLGTDINPGFLEKARAGRYGDWSFRDSPAGLQERHFEQTEDGLFQVNAQTQARVRFAELNMAQEAYPSAIDGTQDVDLIFCRNLLMYFSEEQARKVVQRLHRCLRQGGWLVVSRSEAGNLSFPGLEPVTFESAVVFRKVPATPICIAARSQSDATKAESPLPPGAAGTAQRTTESVALYRTTACTLADQGRHLEALAWCDRWMDADSFDAQAHYVRGVVLIEQGDAAGGRHALQRCIHLQPSFVLAHMALGQLERGHGRTSEAAWHLGRAGKLLRALQPDQPLPEADGFTPARLHKSFAVVALEGRA